MTYVDTSVVLAHVLAEDRQPPSDLWDDVLMASELVEYETWVRLNRLGLTDSHREVADATLGRLRFVAMAPEVLARARHPFPVPVRTLDALHLATAVYLAGMGDVAMATYDERLGAAASALGLGRYPLSDHDVPTRSR